MHQGGLNWREQGYRRRRIGQKSAMRPQIPNRPHFSLIAHNANRVYRHLIGENGLRCSGILQEAVMNLMPFSSRLLSNNSVRPDALLFCRGRGTFMSAPALDNK